MDKKLSPKEKRALLKRLAGGAAQPAAAPSVEEGKAHHDPAHFPEYRMLRKEIDGARAMRLENPYFKVHEGTIRDTTQIDGRTLIDYSTYNYVGLSGDPEVSEAAKAAIDTYGTSVSASRIASGERPIHRHLEAQIARFLGVEDSITFVGGFFANEATIGHLLGPRDLIIHDSLAHRSALQGAILSRAKRIPFAHNDPDAAQALLEAHRKDHDRALIFIEGAYSMDGDVPDLARFVELKREHKALLMVDEAHSFGVLGKTGRGISEHAGVDPKQVDIWMGTLSKSLASCGGFIAGKKELVEYLRYTIPEFVYSAGMSPANTAAALAALRKLEREPERVTTLHARIAQFLKQAQAAGLDTGPANNTGVVPVIVGDSITCLTLGHHLFDRGINVQPILHPAVERGTERLRFFLSSTHSPAQIEQTVKIVAEELEMLRSDQRAEKERKNLELIKGLYEALEQQNLERLKTALDPEVELVVPGPKDLPFPTGRFKGPKAAADFFAAAFAAAQIERQELEEIIIQEDRAVVTGKRFAVAKRSGKAFEEPFAHVLLLKDGKVQKITDYFDTHAVSEAMRG